MTDRKNHGGGLDALEKVIFWALIDAPGDKQVSHAQTRAAARAVREWLRAGRPVYSGHRPYERNSNDTAVAGPVDGERVVPDVAAERPNLEAPMAAAGADL